MVHFQVSGHWSGSPQNLVFGFILSAVFWLSVFWWIWFMPGRIGGAGGASGSQTGDLMPETLHGTLWMSYPPPPPALLPPSGVSREAWGCSLPQAAVKIFGTPALSLRFNDQRWNTVRSTCSSYTVIITLFFSSSSYRSWTLTSMTHVYCTCTVYDWTIECRRFDRFF